VGLALLAGAAVVSIQNEQLSSELDQQYQNGPLTPAGTSSVTLIDASQSRSISSPVSLSMATNLPEGQSQACCNTSSLACGRSVNLVSRQVPPMRWQNLPTEQSGILSSRSISGPSTTSTPVRYLSWMAISVPSKPTAACVQSQKGLRLDRPHRHRRYSPRLRITSFSVSIFSPYLVIVHRLSMFFKAAV
jgi:hypothetical protein